MLLDLIENLRVEDAIAENQRRLVADLQTISLRQKILHRTLQITAVLFRQQGWGDDGMCP